VTWLLGNLTIVRPVRALVQATQRVAAGDLHARTGVPYQLGELGQLARAFDTMAENLALREAAATQATEALQQQRDEIQELSQQLWHAATLATVGELVASIAHELNNPLATVSLRVEALLAQAAASPQQRALAIIDQEVERLGTLVANLLQFSRRGQPQISSVDVCAELEQTLALMQSHLRNHRIMVVRQFAATVSPLQADRQQLRQVFLNLLTNASDAMPDGGTLTVRAAAGCLECAAPAVVIEVSDTGVGITPDALPKVLEPFFTTKPEGKGTGLGCPFVDALSTSITARSPSTAQWATGRPCGWCCR
jgi:signal transduction histidine kinase